MTRFKVNNKDLTQFITGFGKELPDIVFRVKDDYIESAVGKDTHYIRRRLNVKEAKPGEIAVSDVTRLLSFLKATKAGEVTINQMNKTTVLHVACGKSTLQLPTSSYLVTQKQLPLIERLVKEGEKNMWQKWANFSLDCHGIVNGEDFAPAAQFDKVIGGKFSCKTAFDPASGFVIHAGGKAKGKMFVRIPVTNSESKNTTVKSAFAYWLPALLSNLPPGPLNLHTGDETVLVLEQGDTGFLLVVMDQEYEED
tara:strand:- start:1377 stop:2135 length:759 start_codon:yes stop_codon:yes gene_type:complete